MRPDGAQLSVPTDEMFQFVSTQQDKDKPKQDADDRTDRIQRLNKLKEAMEKRGLSVDRTQLAERIAAKMKSQLPTLKLTKEQQILAAFCQSLMASAEFRILD